MNRIHKFLLRHNTLFILLVLVSLSCKKTSDQQYDTPGASQIKPIANPLTFSDEKDIVWEVVDQGTIKPPKSTYLDLDKLPTRPFKIPQFEPLKESLQVYSLGWENTPKQSIVFDTADIRQFNLEISEIPEPIIREINNPIPQEDLKSGFLSLSISDGLPDVSVLDIISDGAGGQWLATASTLCHFDGERLRIYPYTSIEAILLDSENRIWTVSNKQGIYVLDITRNTAYHYASEETYMDIAMDHSGSIWVVSSSSSGIFQIDWNDATVKQYRLNVKSCVSILEDNNYNIWLGTQNKIAIIDSSRMYYKLPELDDFAMDYITDLYEDSQSNIWAINYTGGDIAKISLAKDSVHYLREFIGTNNRGGKFIEDADGNLYISRDNELSILNQDQTLIKKIPTNSSVVGTWQISPLYLDHLGVLWIGTLGRGILFKDLYGLDIQYLDKSNGLTDVNIWEIMQSSTGDLWIGNESGIDIISKNRNQIKSLDHDLLRTNGGSSNISYIRELDNGNYFIRAGLGFNIIDPAQKRLTQYSIDQQINSGVNDVMIDADGVYWLAVNKGLFRFDIQRRTLSTISEKGGQIPGNEVENIIVDSLSHYWLATTRGLVIIDPIRNTIQYLTEEEGLCHNDIMDMVLDEQGKLWIATLKGLSLINFTDQEIINFGTESLQSDELYDLTEGADQMYIGSVNGLMAMDKKPNENGEYNVIYLGPSQGFIRHDYHQKTSDRDDNGNIWMVASPNPKIVIFKDKNPSALSDPEVYITGLSILDKPFRFSDSLSASSDYSVKMEWADLKYPYNLPSGLKLPSDQNSLRFRYATNNIFYRDKIVYRYLLEGKDEDWIYATSHSETPNYHNLSPGHYTFKVSVQNLNGEWSNPDELSFEIHPPWWRMWWAFILYGIVLAGIIILIVNYRSKRLKEKNRQLEKTVADRTKKLRISIENLKATQSQLIQSEKMASLGELTAGIAHEIQNPLNFVNNFSEVNQELLDELEIEIEKGNKDEITSILGSIRENEKKVILHGKRADAIVKSMLQHSRTSSLEKEFTDINALCDEYLRLAYHGFRAREKSFNATFHTNLDPDLPKINVVPQDIGRVLLNLINNAFQATSAEASAKAVTNYKPEVIVATRRVDSFAGSSGRSEMKAGDRDNAGAIEIIISDNGPGIPDEIKDKIFQPFFTTKPAGQGTGLGLSLSYDIVHKGHGGELRVETGKSEGTTFIIELPIGKS
ncbi:MAG: hypothetical protein KDC80_00300 [Saprospiraceae bacterium]|nr:hypothetical protein [Saprospiraceae bacterium]